MKCNGVIPFRDCSGVGERCPRRVRPSIEPATNRGRMTRFAGRCPEMAQPRRRRGRPGTGSRLHRTGRFRSRGTTPAWSQGMPEGTACWLPQPKVRWSEMIEAAVTKRSTRDEHRASTDRRSRHQACQGDPGAHGNRGGRSVTNQRGEAVAASRRRDLNDGRRILHGANLKRGLTGGQCGEKDA